mmetsp:Transcript_27211/g.50163  ORF Transcript_27211/g.50163 Transcript_27211/m.50163 type:complete len:119 (+) Transcript_27211:359-715(+)
MSCGASTRNVFAFLTALLKVETFLLVINMSIERRKGKGAKEEGKRKDGEKERRKNEDVKKEERKGKERKEKDEKKEERMKRIANFQIVAFIATIVLFLLPSLSQMLAILILPRLALRT